MHISKRKNLGANMLSTVRYIYEDELEAYKITKGNEDEDYGYILTMNRVSINDSDLSLKEDLHKVRLRNIGIYLSSLRR